MQKYTFYFRTKLVFQGKNREQRNFKYLKYIGSLKMHQCVGQSYRVVDESQLQDDKYSSPDSSLAVPSVRHCWCESFQGLPVLLQERLVLQFPLRRVYSLAQLDDLCESSTCQEDSAVSGKKGETTTCFVVDGTDFQIQAERWN